MESQIPETKGEVWSQEDIPLVEEDQVREDLNKDVILAAGEVPEVWRKANVMPIFKKGKKLDPGNYRLVSLTTIPGKVTE